MKKRNKNRVVFFNGKFVKENKVKFYIYDSTLMFSDTVFEIIKSFNKNNLC